MNKLLHFLICFLPVRFIIGIKLSQVTDRICYETENKGVYFPLCVSEHLY